MITRTVLGRDLAEMLPFEAGDAVRVDINPDLSIVLSDATKPRPVANGEQSPRILRTCTSAAIKLKAARVENGKKLRPFFMIAYTGAPMRLDGFNRAVLIDLTGLRVPSQRLPILRQHDPERIVAHSEKVNVSKVQLTVAGIMSGTGAAAKEVLDLAENGFPWGASVGAAIEQIELVEAGKSVSVNGRTWDGPFNIARKTVLREISFVPMGADLETSAAVGD